MVRPACQLFQTHRPLRVTDGERLAWSRRGRDSLDHPVRAEPMTEPRNGHQRFEVRYQAQATRAGESTDAAGPSRHSPTAELEQRADCTVGESADMGGIVPHCSRNGPWGSQEEGTLGANDPEDFTHDGDGIGDVFDDVLQQNSVEGVCGKRQRVGIGSDKPVDERRRCTQVDADDRAQLILERGTARSQVEQRSSGQFCEEVVDHPLRRADPTSLDYRNGGPSA